MNEHLDESMRIARLWKAGKMLGYPEDEVAVPLLDHIDRLTEAAVDLLNQIENCDSTSQLNTESLKKLLTGGCH